MPTYAEATENGGATSIDVTNPVFFKRNDLIQANNNDVDTFEICVAAEKISGYNTIEGAQLVRDLWRLYPKTTEARAVLLTTGLDLRNQHIRLMDRNPFLTGGTGSTPSTKVIISNLPLSVSNDDITP